MIGADNIEDSNFLIRFKAGDRPAFNELVLTCRSRVINTCYRFLLKNR